MKWTSDKTLEVFCTRIRVFMASVFNETFRQIQPNFDSIWTWVGIISWIRTMNLIHNIEKMRFIEKQSNARLNMVLDMIIKLPQMQTSRFNTAVSNGTITKFHNGISFSGTVFHCCNWNCSNLATTWHSVFRIIILKNLEIWICYENGCYHSNFKINEINFVYSCNASP